MSNAPHMMPQIKKLFCCLIAAQVFIGTPAFAKADRLFADVKMTPDIQEEIKANQALRADAMEAANVLKIRPLVDKLLQAKASGITNVAALPRPLLNAKLICLWRISESMMEVRKADAHIDVDLAASNIALDALTGKRNKVLTALNNANFLQGGTLGCVKQGLFLHEQFTASQYPLLISFGTGTALAVLSLMVPYIWSEQIDGPPNILSHIFNAKYKPPDIDHSFLWTFVDTPIPGSHLDMTRREILIHHWEDIAGLNITKERALRKLSQVREGDEDLSESIAILQQRIALLHDLRTHLEELDGSLYELHHAISFGDN